MGEMAVRSEGQFRAEMRRGLAIEVELFNGDFFEPLNLRTTDVSLSGLFLTTPLVFDPGEHVTLKFRPPKAANDLVVPAEVSRVMLQRRRSDRGPAGMGLRFLDVPRDAQRALRRSLRGVPPPLPRWVSLGLPATRDVLVLSEHDLDLMLVDKDHPLHDEFWITDFEC